MVAGYSGDAGNALMTLYDVNWNANGRKFSTPDDNNNGFALPCGQNGWWYGACSSSQINWSNKNGGWTAGNWVEDVQATRMMVKLN